MSLLYLDCFAGLAGDMMLGLLLDLGLPLDDLQADLRRVSLGGYDLRVTRVRPQGIAATKLDVLVAGDAEAAHHAHLHVHDPGEHGHGEPTRHGHGHARSLAEIEALIGASTLAPAIRDRALHMFRVLGEAEAHVHGVPQDHIHFHEVGAIDSIVDIVGTAIGIERLGIDRVEAGAIPVGGGTIDVAHGRMPIPAPAAAHLLRDMPTYDPGIPHEMVTPTGAAILRVLVDAFGPQPPMRVTRLGYGAGTRDFSPLPNVVRGRLGVPSSGSATGVVVLETTVDDMLPEHLGYTLERLLEADALDVFFTPIQGKKNRPGTLITVLSSEERQAALTDILFRETTTFGIRVRREARVILDRDFVAVQTPWGRVDVKVGRQNGAVLTVAPEFEQCKRLAQAAGEPLRTVYDHAKHTAIAQLQETS